MKRLSAKFYDHGSKLLVAAASTAVLLLLLFLLEGLQGEASSHRPAGEEAEYASRLFDSSRVHTLDIQMEDWKAFIQEAGEERYTACTVVIDGERFPGTGIRAKGNNSLRLTEKYGLPRYSLKLEFDRYKDGGNYYGLDKFSLDSSFQDNSYLKTFLTYDMMDFMGVPSPLCSYVQVSVNGKPWGLFLAIEEPEEAFARRVFGEDHGQLYKPDYRSLADENADVALRYTGEDPAGYGNIFHKAKFPVTAADQERLIGALKTLHEGENLESAIHVDEVLRYFAVQVFVMNWDSYLGRTGHNYFLYEKDGILSILPWDYNLAYGTYALGMSEPIRDPYILVNYPIVTPAEGEVMKNRPLYHNLMKVEEYFQAYLGYFDQLLEGYFESGYFSSFLRETAEMIEPYVAEDPTAFCSYESHLLAVDVLERLCLLRAESVQGQLEGTVPATLRERQERPGDGVDTGDIRIEDLGDFEDLETAGERNRINLEDY